MIDYKEEFSKEGYTLLRVETSASGKTLIGRCLHGHEYKVTSSRWRTGARCKQCFQQAQKDSILNKYKQSLSKENYTLLKVESTTQGPKLYSICPAGHNHSTLASNWNSGYRCKECKSTKWNLEKVRESFSKEGYQLTSTTFTSTKDYYSFMCPEKHEHKITLNSWLKGSRCGLCYFKTISKDSLEKEASLNKLKIVKEPSNSIDQLTMQCLTCEHVWNTTYFHWKKCKDQSCPKCRGQAKYSQEDIKAFLSKEGYELTSEYENASKPIKTICPSKHEYICTFTNFQQGYRCGSCTNKTSAPHRELLSIYASLEPLSNTKEVIGPKELDIYFKSKNVAMEYCGLYYHSDKMDHITPAYHYNKMIACNEKGVRLITIFEDEWLQRKDVCLSRINNALSISSNKIYARKCAVRQISKEEALSFLNKNHLQGSGKADICFGLFYNELLIQVVTGGKPNRKHTSAGKKVFELKRLASLVDYNIVGGAGKLFEAFKKYAVDQNFDTIKSYCDMRWGTGNLYSKLGFKLTYTTKYTPHYTKGVKRLRGQTLKKTKGSTLTEKELRIKEGYSIIYDCGHQTWTYNIGK